MATNQYIGARYVPVFADPADWDATRTYEPLTVVLHGGNSYTSKQYVPNGIDIDNADFWAETGNYNSQVEQYRKEVNASEVRIAENAQAIADEVTARKTMGTEIQGTVTAETERAKTAEQTITDKITAETERAKTAEQTITDKIAAETERANAAENAIYHNVCKKFDSVSTMKNDASLQVNDVVLCKRYNTTFDYPILFEISSSKIDTSISLGNGLFANVIFGDYVSPEMFGAYCDGTHDDYDAIISAFNQNLDIVCGHTVYTSKQLVYTGTNNITLSVTALNSNFSGSVFKISNPSRTARNKNFILSIDANKNPIGLESDVTLCNIWVSAKNALEACVKHTNGYGTHFWIAASNLEIKDVNCECSGLLITIGDCYIDFIESINCKYGVTNNAGYNKYGFVHPWCYGSDAIYKNSVAFVANSTCGIDSLYNDTMNYGLQYKNFVNDYSVCIGEFRTLFNDNGVSDEAAASNPPRIVKCSDTLKSDSEHGFIYIDTLHGYKYKNTTVSTLNDTDYNKFELARLIIDNMFLLNYKGTFRNAPYCTFAITKGSDLSDVVWSSELLSYATVTKTRTCLPSSLYKYLVSAIITTMQPSQFFICRLAEFTYNLDITYNAKKLSLAS